MVDERKITPDACDRRILSETVEYLEYKGEIVIKPPELKSHEKMKGS